MPADEKSLLEGPWDTFASTVFNVCDGYGWILPALLLTILLLGVLLLIAYAAEDLPIDVEVFDGIGGIFKWTRRWWKGTLFRPVVALLARWNSGYLRVWGSLAQNPSRCPLPRVGVASHLDSRESDA